MSAGIVVAAFVGLTVISIGGWDISATAAHGYDFGRTAMQVVQGVPLDDKRVPLGIAVMLNIPLWACFVGGPWLATRREPVDWRTYIGWSMEPIDVPIGLGVGVLTQVIVLPALYYPILRLIDGGDLGEPARNLVASADTAFDVGALVVLTIIGAPIAEEILYRGMLYRGIADMEADRGRVGVALAVVASAAIFAGSHLQLLQFPGLFVIGAIAALGFHLTGRLGMSIWIHVGFNATTVIVLLADIY